MCYQKSVVGSYYPSAKAFVYSSWRLIGYIDKCGFNLKIRISGQSKLSSVKRSEEYFLVNWEIMQFMHKINYVMKMNRRQLILFINRLLCSVSLVLMNQSKQPFSMMIWGIWQGTCHILQGVSYSEHLLPSDYH